MVFTPTNPPSGYYVYAYIRASNNTPYYIGKGKADRAWSKNHNIKVPKNKNKIMILEHNLTEIGALAIERRMIAWYGRLDLGTGILRNMTDGGDGTSGRIFSQNSKEKISKTLMGHKRTKESIEKTRLGNMGCKRTEKFKKNLSEKRTGKNNPFYGKTHTDEVRLKISKSHTGKTYNQPKFYCEHCGILTIKSNIVRWHGDKCKSKFTVSNL